MELLAMHRKHALHMDLHKALNKHRELRTSKEKLVKLLKGVYAYEGIKRIRDHKGRAVSPKVPNFMTVTATEGTDNIIDFLNSGPAMAFSYVTDRPTAYPYFSMPSLDTLGQQLHLKEELLYHLGLYNHMAAANAVNKIVDLKGPQRDSLEHFARWAAYGYKSFAKLATKTAEKLGAVCLLLRYEATARQNTPLLGDILIYNTDVIGPSIIMLEGQESFDSAITSGSLKPIARSNQSFESTPFRTGSRPFRKGPAPHFNSQRTAAPYRPTHRGNQAPFRAPPPRFVTQSLPSRGRFQPRNPGVRFANHNPHMFHPSQTRNNGDGRAKTHPSVPYGKRPHK